MVQLKGNSLEKSSGLTTTFKKYFPTTEKALLYERTPEKIEELQDYITEMQDEIESIKDDPDGDFPDDLIQEKIDELVDDARSDPEHFINEYGLDWEDFIDKDEFIDAVIDADGYGHTLNGYDGSADEIQVQGTFYWVMRID